MKQCRRPQKKTSQWCHEAIYCMFVGAVVKTGRVWQTVFTPLWPSNLKKKSRVHSRLLGETFALVLSDHWFGKHEASPMVKCFDASLIGVENLEPIIAHRCWDLGIVTGAIPQENTKESNHSQQVAGYQKLKINCHHTTSKQQIWWIS